MARIAGVDLPNNKRAEIALRYIYGIGPTLARIVCQKAGVDPQAKLSDLPEDLVNRLREIVDKGYRVEGDLRREVQMSIRRKIEINCYQGTRHRRGLPARGQRTRTNARTKKGARKTVAGKRRVAAKK
ncbi:MAG: 30S ribosomal protein S13 [Dehalococcoidia bacterium]|nr:30S ribosomal protein S13 [Dehalococcoidia bacterium]